jgi:4-diphosphocytidyl-2-C-methyl-D-erythritol kinase
VTVVTARACAKINLTLRVLGSRPDGYHELRTTFQSIALHDVLTFVPVRGPFAIECDDPACPTGRGNIVRKAAARLWRAAGRTGSPAGVRVRIEKRIPIEAGLGGGSADAAAALRALAALWRIRLDDDVMRGIAVALGADVAFFLQGGTALGVERGDEVVRLPDEPRQWVVLVVPPFGVSTEEAYGWFDAATLKGSPYSRSRGRFAEAGVGRFAEAGVGRRAEAGVGRRAEAAVRLTDAGVGRPFQGRCKNDLQAPVVERHPEIGRIIQRLKRLGAAEAAMSGSGSAVFGLFEKQAAAEAAADAMAGKGRTSIVTRTVARGEYTRLTAPRLARK